jgi:hypothetical protein
MALANNTRDQLAKRLKQDLQLLAPEFTVAVSACADGNPSLTLSNAAGVQAYIAIKRRTYVGFNIVAELSASAAEGTPEHECWLDLNTGLGLVEVVKLTKAAAGIGCSSLKVLSSAAPADADLVDANVLADIPNDARVGYAGN